MPAVLHLKPEEIDTPEKRAKLTVSIIGCGQHGIFYALSFAEAGFKVICVDTDQSIVKKLSKGNVPFVGREVEAKLKILIKKEQMSTTNEIKNAVAKSDIIIITANLRGEHKNINHTEIASCCKQIGAALQRESLVVYSEVVGLGLIKSTIKETIEDTSGLKVGKDFGLVYSPLQNPTQQWEAPEACLVIAALDKVSLNSAIAIFSTLGKKNIKATMNIEAAELATLFKAAKRDINLALANELAIFCENVGVDYLETMKLSWDDYEAGLVRPSISQDANQSTAGLLEDSAESLNTKLRLPLLAKQINEYMIKHAVNLTQEALRKSDKTIRRAKIAIIGTANTGTANIKFIELLESKGAKINQYDPIYFQNSTTDTGRIIKKTINETVEGADCLVLLSEQEQLKRLNLKKLKAIMKSPAAIVDLTGTVEPNRAQDEGFIYRGLGRGTWKK